MENPMTWGPIHKAINLADATAPSRDVHVRAETILKVLQETKPSITLEQVVEVIHAHQTQMDEHVCGLSLCSMIFNRFM